MSCGKQTHVFAMEHANVWTGSQRKSVTRKPSSSAFLNIPTTSEDNSFLRKFSFVNYSSASVPEDHGTGIQLPSTFMPDFHDRASVLKLRFNYVGNTGMHFSALGFGGATLGNIPPAEEERAIQAIQFGLKLGINYIATSPAYGNGRSETLLGTALSSIPRKTYYISTSVGRYRPDVGGMFDFSAERVIRSVDESLARLQIPYVDVVQVQDVEFAPNLEMILSETLPALEKVVNSGKARFIGIGSYNVSTIQFFFREIVSKCNLSGVPIDAVMSNCRYGLFNRDLKDIIPDLKEEGVGIINTYPMGMGLLSQKGPAETHPAPESLRRAAKEAVAFAKSRGEDLGKVALKYCYKVPNVSSTVVNMDSTEGVRDIHNTCISPMTENENAVMHEAVRKYFVPLGRTHWENIEVTKYWEQMENAGLVKPRPLNAIPGDVLEVIDEN